MPECKRAGVELECDVHDGLSCCMAMQPVVRVLNTRVTVMAAGERCASRCQ